MHWLGAYVIKLPWLFENIRLSTYKNLNWGNNSVEAGWKHFNEQVYVAKEVGGVSLWIWAPCSFSSTLITGEWSRHYQCPSLLSLLLCGWERNLRVREKRTCQSSKCDSPGDCGRCFTYPPAPQGGAELLEIVQWGAWGSSRGHRCQEACRWQKLKLVEQKWAGFQKRAAFQKWCAQYSLIH